MEIKYLQVLVMPNGEVICAGKTIGWTSDAIKGEEVKTLGAYLFSKDEVADAQE